MYRFATLIIAMLVLPIPTAAGEAAEATRPAAAFAWRAGDQVIAAWLPGTEEPDHYNVYGFEGDHRVLLASPTDTFAIVPGSFSRLEVVAVVDEEEGTPVPTSEPIRGPCVTIYYNPPGVYVGCMGSPLVPLANPLPIPYPLR